DGFPCRIAYPESMDAGVHCRYGEATSPGVQCDRVAGNSPENRTDDFRTKGDRPRVLVASILGGFCTISHCGPSLLPGASSRVAARLSIEVYERPVRLGGPVTEKESSCIPANHPTVGRLAGPCGGTVAGWPAK